MAVSLRVKIHSQRFEKVTALTDGNSVWVVEDLIERGGREVGCHCTQRHVEVVPHHVALDRASTQQIKVLFRSNRIVV